MKTSISYFLLCLLPLISSPPSHGWFLPGSAPLDHKYNDEINIRVNPIISLMTQIPYGYYFAGFPKPEKIIANKENLGEMLIGARSENSLYQFHMLANEKLKIVGGKEITLSLDKINFFKYLISKEYFVQMQCEDLPVTSTYQLSNSEEKVSFLGSYVGYKSFNMENDRRPSSHILYNHLIFNISYNQPDPNVGEYRIVGIEASQKSCMSSPGEDILAEDSTYCNGTEIELESLTANDTILFTYDVYWTPSNISWASRWDVYRKLEDTKILWISILNALFIITFLGCLVAIVLYRILLRDINRYNDISTFEDIQEEWGWKLLHGDVFRKPPYFSLLLSFIGTGIQILGIFMVASIFFVLGISSPESRGLLVQLMIFCFGLMGFPAGYVCAKFLHLYEDKPSSSIRAPLYTALFFPGLCFGTFFLLNLFLWYKRSSGAVSFSVLLILLIFWFCVSIPFVFWGYKFGSKKSSFRIPVRVNKIPREIPKHTWIHRPIFSYLIGGVLPFGAAFTELIFIMGSIWMHRFYSLFSFLLIVLIILIITCGEVSISLSYFRLTSEDYKWWWKSFYFSAFSAFYLFLFTIFFFFFKLEITGFVPTCLYFGYMFLITVAFFFLTGSCGFIATFFFIKSIYSSIKVD